MKPISDIDLATLIDWLWLHKKAGIDDSWKMSDGTEIDPLQVLTELRNLRELRKVIKKDDI